MKKELQLDLFKENVNEQTTNELKISSREIAELTGKRHDNVLRDCDILNQNYEKMTLLKIEEGIIPTRTRVISNIGSIFSQRFKHLT